MIHYKKETGFEDKSLPAMRILPSERQLCSQSDAVLQFKAFIKAVVEPIEKELGVGGKDDKVHILRRLLGSVVELDSVKSELSF